MTKQEERILMVKAMEYICRQINDEDNFMSWLYGGVADEDIKYGDFSWTLGALMDISKMRNFLN